LADRSQGRGTRWGAEQEGSASRARLPIRNFDDEVFDDPFRFDIPRNPNSHVSFAGTGAHYCVGANLTQLTINLMFAALADAVPDLKPHALPERLRSGWLNCINHWQVYYSGGYPVGRLCGGHVCDVQS